MTTKKYHSRARSERFSYEVPQLNKSKKEVWIVASIVSYMDPVGVKCARLFAIRSELSCRFFHDAEIRRAV